MGQLAGADAERQRAKPAMGAGMAVAADDQAAGKAEAKLGSDHMDDALPGFIDIEHPDAGRRRLGPQARQQLLSDLAGAGPSARRRNRMIRRCERQLRIVHRQVAVFEIEQATRAAQIVQQMTIDMKQIGVVADATDNVLVPDLGQQRSGGRLHCRILPFFLLLWQVDAPPPAVLHGLLFRSSPERASDDQNISEALGQRLIWWARPHTGVGRRQIEAAHPIHPVDPLQALTGQFQEAVSRSLGPARVCPSPQRRAIHGVAAKIAKEAGVLLKAPRHRCRPSEQTAEHHSGRPAADDATTPVQTVTWRRHCHHDECIVPPCVFRATVLPAEPGYSLTSRFDALGTLK